ncbi:MAG: NUDIX domain-containing protein [Planctomycetes bacterium]|nr:NUDIX domain-containing protein [Planctomycetota bacterium]
MPRTEPNKLFTKFPRPAARALIVHAGKLLAIHMRSGPADFYVLPGGGQRHGETLQQALLRECREELGCRVVIHELAFVREYIGKHHEYPKQHAGFHAVECIFRCTLPNGAKVRPGHAPDPEQIGVAWLPIRRVTDFDLYPKTLRRYLRDNKLRLLPIYLSDIV